MVTALFDLTQLSDAVTQHGRVARVVIVDSKGSAPRDAGTAMLVWADGQSGTIGGGTLEYQASDAAREMLIEKREWHRQRRAVPLGPALGQCCGGSVILLTEVFSAVEITEIDTSIKPLNRFSRSVHSGVKPSANDVAGPGIYSEDLQDRHQPLWIYGAGHVGRALVNVLAPLDFDLTWIDTDQARYPGDIPSQVSVLPSMKPADVVKYAPVNAQHLILTYSHALDLEICHQILSHSFHFAGLIGSATKWARFQSRLAGLGHSQTQIARITCPIGDPALGKSPQAIAVSVAAALLKDVTGKVAPLAKETAIDLF